MPSGEIRGYMYARAGAPIGSSRPWRFTQTSDNCRPAGALAVPGTYSRLPLRDTANSASPVEAVFTPSTTGTGSPVTSSRLKLKGTARSEPAAAYTRCPLSTYCACAPPRISVFRCLVCRSITAISPLSA